MTPRKRFIWRSLVLALALVGALVATLPSNAGPSKRTRSSGIAPGVTLTVIRDYGGPFRIRIVSMQQGAEARLDTVLANDRLPKFETTSSMAARTRAVAAINGDYARPTGRPVHTFAFDGVLAQTPLAWGRNFAADHTGTSTYMGNPKVSGWARETDTGNTFPIDLVNAGAPSGDQIARYTREGGGIEKPPAGICQVRLYASGSPYPLTESPGVETRHFVDRVRCGGKSIKPLGGSILATPLTSVHAPTLAALTPGEEVTLGWSTGWRGVLDTIGGNPTLIEGGTVIEGNVAGSGPFFERHPRTGIGTTPDGKVLMVVVDGRQTGYSVGMTLREFANLFRSLGADWALNIDGGGSSTLAIDGRVINRPSDGYERGVSSALVVLPGADPGEADPTPQPDSPLYTLTRHAVWPSIAEDPASTGGLADHLLRSGQPLAPSLRGAAAEFRRSR
ncbi:MAG: phosphodiester glycosidase family protein [Actinomycetota bacterium]